MGIDPKIEQPTRAMLGHAMRHELEDLASLVGEAGDDAVAGAIGLCVFASGYIAIDVCERWPTQADLQEIAKSAAKSATKLDLDESEIYEYLSRVALGQEKLDDVFAMPKAGMLPLLITANLLATFRPREKHWWEYLDQIWDAAETAEHTSLTVLPALMLRAHKESTSKVSTVRNFVQQHADTKSDDRNHER
jgi:hypothetical protein